MIGIQQLEHLRCLESAVVSTSLREFIAERLCQLDPTGNLVQTIDHICLTELLAERNDDVEG